MIDPHGNKINITPTGKIVLELTNGKKINIGQFNKTEKRFYMRRDRDKHLLRKANAYGFNYELLNRAKIATHILLSDDFGDYEIPISSILKSGSFLWFKTQGFERQIFFTIEQIFTYKII